MLDDFDIVEEAGGAYRPVIREFDAAADSSGALVLEFVQGAADHPQVSAIEVLPAAGGKPLYAINAGGPAGGAFAADQYYNGGNIAGE